MRWSFAECMHEWLYGDEGYYHHAHIGKEGDFYTAVSASRLFGGVIAQHVLRLLESSELTLPLCIIEIGAHRGELMRDVYDFFAALSYGAMEQTRFYIVEPLDSLKNSLDMGGRAVICVSKLDEVGLGEGESAFVLSNELFDAFACEIVRRKDTMRNDIHSSIDDIEMLYVKGNGNSLLESRGTLQLEWLALGGLPQQKAHDICAFLERYGGDIQAMECVELPLAWEGFINDVCKYCARATMWRFLSFDYVGLGHKGASLRGFWRHRVLSMEEVLCNINELYGQIDITYNVDFDMLARIFASYGGREIFRGRFGALLVEFGVGELLDMLRTWDGKQYEIESMRIRGLLSGAMGEKFMGICFGGKSKGSDKRSRYGGV